MLLSKEKLNYRFRNPNSPEAAAEYILAVCLSANAKKVEQAIQSAASQNETENRVSVPV